MLKFQIELASKILKNSLSVSKSSPLVNRDLSFARGEWQTTGAFSTAGTCETWQT